MGKYIGSWKIDDVLQHKVQTSSVTTGAATDADSVPTWSLYEDGTTAPVTTGSYTTFNSVTGFYNAAITLAAAIGYEKGKNYYIRYSATVASIIGADVDTFQIEAEVDANSVSVTVNANVASVSAGAFQSVTIGSVAGTVGSVAAGVTVSSTSQAAIVDAVWSETAAGYTTAGSMGFQLAEAESLGALVNAIWDEPKANHTTADTYGEYLDATLSGIGAAGAVTVGSTSAAAIAAAVQALALTVGATSHSAIALAVQALAMTVGATAQAAIAARVTAGSIGAVTVGSTSATAIQSGLATQASVDTIDDFLDTEVAAIKAKTDQLTFGVTNALNVNLEHVHGTSVTGNGQSGTEWGPGS